MLPASKPSGYCTTILCPCPIATQRLFRIMWTGARFVRRAWPSKSGGSPPSSGNRINSCPSPIASPIAAVHPVANRLFLPSRRVQGQLDELLAYAVPPHPVTSMGCDPEWFHIGVMGKTSASPLLGERGREGNCGLSPAISDGESRR